jgi:PAS domain S-box-containing protein
VAFASRLLLDPLLREQAPLLLFTLAVAVSAIRGGFGPGVLSTFLGAFGAVYFFPPKGAFLSITPGYLPAAAREMAVFLVVGVILSWLGGKLRRLRWEALELATQRKEILESITDGFMALDADCRFVYLNRVAGQLMQRPRGHIDKDLWEEVPELRGSVLEKRFHQVLGEHVPVHFEYLFPSSNRWFELHAYPTENSGMTVYFRDVSDRKLAEQRLRETLAERNAALDRVQLLSGLLPICAWCKKIRDDEGNWRQMESYISQHSQAKFSLVCVPTVQSGKWRIYLTQATPGSSI